MSAPTTPSSQDLQVAFDPTAYTVIDGAQLGQLVNGASPVNGIGMIVVTADSGTTPNVPDATITTKWQNYMWLRVGATTITAYVWNPNGSYNTSTKYWQTITTSAIAPGTITGGTGGMLALNTVTAANIVSLAYSQLTGAPALAAGSGTALTSDGLFNSSFFNSNTFVWGDLQGSGNTPGTPVVKPLAITAAKIANATITPTQLAAAGTANYQLTDVTGSAPAWTKTPTIVQSGSPVVSSAGNALKVPQVATGVGVDAGTWQMASPNTSAFGRVLQDVLVSDTSIVPSSGNITPGVGALAYNATGMTAYTQFTAKYSAVSASSTIIVEMGITNYNGSGDYVNIAGLFHDTTSTTTAPTAIGYATHQGYGSTMIFKGTFASSSSWVSGLYLKVFFGTNGGTCYTNVAGGATYAMGTSSWIRFTEVI